MIDTIDKVFFGIVEETQRESEDRDLAEISVEPNNRAVHPFEFATAKSRRWYFAQIRKGKIKTDGYGYVRSGAYKKSWQILVEHQGDSFKVRYRSTAKASTYISGKRQVPGHRNTGWLYVPPILNQKIQLFLDRVRVKYTEALGGFGTYKTRTYRRG